MSDKCEVCANLRAIVHDTTGKYSYKERQDARDQLVFISGAHK